MSLLCSETTHVDYIARSLSIAAFVVSAAVGFVAYLQWRLARNKLCLDLFDRRWKIYATTSEFVDAINNDPEHVDSYLDSFNAGTAHAKFLFDSDVVDYITLVRKHAVTMRTAHSIYEKEHDDETRKRHIEKFEGERKWLIEQSKTMPKTFTPYLGFSNIKI